MEDKALERQPRSPWANYHALESGLRHYWYPVLLSRRLKRKPVALRLFGENIVLIRDRGSAYALADHCAHRGTPLSLGKRDFPGTITCIYHGWCYNLPTGKVVAALTDGPDSPIAGKASVRTYPVQERIGLIWIYVGEGDPPPIEEDIPDELLEPGVPVQTRISLQEGNWRFGVENHYDEAHANYLHRDALFSLFWRLPAWKKGIRVEKEGKWLVRKSDTIEYNADYPGLGRWPQDGFWRWYRKQATVEVRLPGIGRVTYPEFTAYKFFTPVDNSHFLFVQVLTKPVTGVRAAGFRLQYWLYRRWLYQVLFNNQDMLAVKTSYNPDPERLFGPDVSITAWRKLCEEARPERQQMRSSSAGLTRVGHSTEGLAEL